MDFLRDTVWGGWVRGAHLTLEEPGLLLVLRFIEHSQSELWSPRSGGKEIEEAAHAHVGRQM
jgi:hypothetical protein